MRRTCPACATRTAAVIDPECVVCEGHGTIILNDAALALYDPETVSEAIHLALEASARKTELTVTRSGRQTRPIREAVVTLRDAGIIGRELRAAPVARRDRFARDNGGRFASPLSAVELAAEYVQGELLALDAVLAHAAPYKPQDGDRINERGLPMLSANLHPSSLSRITDPMDFGVSTPHLMSGTTARTRAAKTLVAAAPEAANKRRQRKAL